MRLFTKFFLFGMFLLGVAFSVSGYFLLHYSLESSLAREVDFALMQYQYDKFTVQSAFLTYSDVAVTVSRLDDGIPWGKGGSYAVWQTYPAGTSVAGKENGQDGLDYVAGQPSASLLLVLAGEIGVPVAFYGEDKVPLYTEIEGLEEAFLEGLSPDAHVYRFQEGPEGSAVLVGSVLDWDGVPVSFVTQWDISKTMAQQETLRQYFMRYYLVAMAAGMVLLGGLSALLTRPLKRMARGAGRMADGNYGERFQAPGRDEIGELAHSFNQMADAVEEKIGELERSAREKEDFVANFAHELKTPLTSIIGYADTIYQKELPREEVRRASWHIWNEGMRLEGLSFKLMELTVLGRQDFVLEEMPAAELLQDVAEGLEPLFVKKEIALQLEAAPAYVRVEYDLLKTLLLNLCDNACKAGASQIRLEGHIETGQTGDVYGISVTDNGCGMEEEELSRITEAFYMVDKARSRKQHGAGLGLTLADRIARIHGSRLLFQSQKGQGTRVSFSLECVRETGEREGEEAEGTR